ncbi:hypothetical protein QBC39DRAFT_28062 [Podospora conica]|nr:hypothetical protein QBC39DRAFT_28062 [Schizothecium conicum]
MGAFCLPQGSGGAWNQERRCLTENVEPQGTKVSESLALGPGSLGVEFQTRRVDDRLLGACHLPGHAKRVEWKSPLHRRVMRPSPPSPSPCLNWRTGTCCSQKARLCPYVPHVMVLGCCGCLKVTRSGLFHALLLFCTAWLPARIRRDRLPTGPRTAQKHLGAERGPACLPLLTSRLRRGSGMNVPRPRRRPEYHGSGGRSGGCVP